MARATLKKGSQGDDVKHLQTVLNKNGYNLTVDGIFGDKTLAAVQEYQKKNGLSVDGEVGVNTWTSLSKNGGLASDVDFSYDEFKAPTYTESESVTNAKGKLGEVKDKIANYGDYTEGNSVKDYKDKLTSVENSLSNYGDFSYANQNDLDGIIQNILDRGKFSYDLNGDALYQQYKDKYTQQGKMAMRDTMGQAAAMTGGYGNSYAQAVGNQAYQASLDNLNDIVPELYQMAYDRYNQEGQDLYNKYGLLSGERESQYGLWSDKYNRLANDRSYYADSYNNERTFDYGQFMDGLNRYLTDRSYYADVLNNERTFDYGKFVDDRAFDYGKYLDDKNYAYNNYVNAVANEGKSGGTKEETGTEVGNNGGNDVGNDVGNDGGNDGGESSMYADFDALDWESYFATIRNTEGKSAAEKELSRMNKAGLIPTNMVVYASIGARGSFGH